MRRSRRGGERGLSVIGALFVLLVLAALGAWLATISATQALAVAQGELGARAHYGARAGLEWALHAIVNGAGAGLDCGPGTTSFTLGGGALAGFDVSVECAVQTVTEGSRTYQLYQLRSTASAGAVGSPDRASRTLIATVAM